MTKSCIVDTNILLNGIDLMEYEKIYCPITVLEELDKLKMSDNPAKSFKSRVAIRNIQKLKNKIEYTISFEENMEQLPNGLDKNKPDNIIISHALMIQKTLDKESIMITQDLNMIEKCHAIGIKVKDLNDYKKKEIYKGYKVITIENDNELSYFYENLHKNIFDLLINEYIIIKDKSDCIISILKWTGEEHIDLTYRKLNTEYTGTIIPLDEIQKCAFDSMFTNDITCLFGKSGTGKTSLVLGYALHVLKKGNVNKIYILTTCKDLKGSEPIGFLPGNKDEKLLNDNIGMILTTKFGGIDPINELINGEQLEVLPLSKIRGVEFSENDIVIVTESQNINVYQMKTILQRCKMGCKILIEGDMLEQKDVANEEDCGMERMIDIFKGSKHFGCVKLKNNYRNPISELADEM